MRAISSKRAEYEASSVSLNEAAELTAGFAASTLSFKTRRVSPAGAEVLPGAIVELVTVASTVTTAVPEPGGSADDAKGSMPTKKFVAKMDGVVIQAANVRDENSHEFSRLSVLLSIIVLENSCQIQVRNRACPGLHFPEL